VNQVLLVRLAGVHTDKQLQEAVAGKLPDHNPDKPEPGKREKPAPDKPEPDKQDRPGEEGKAKPGDDLKSDQSQTESDPVVKELARRVSPNFEATKKMIDVRPGFSNYFFNRLERDRVWKSLSTAGDFSTLESGWQFNGTVTGEATKMAISISPIRGKLQIGLRSVEVDFTGELSDLVARRNETGLLLGLLAWQQFLQLGPDRMGSSIYLGTVPIYKSAAMRLASAQMCDTLQVTWQDAQVRIHIPRSSNEIVSLEVFGDMGYDPVELYLDQYNERDGRRWPSRIRLQYGTDPILLLSVESVSVASERLGEPAP
jgi:hypothetical protein